MKQWNLEKKIILFYLTNRIWEDIWAYDKSWPWNKEDHTNFVQQIIKNQKIADYFWHRILLKNIEDYAPYFYKKERQYLLEKCKKYKTVYHLEQDKYVVKKEIEELLMTKCYAIDFFFDKKLPEDYKKLFLKKIYVY